MLKKLQIKFVALVMGVVVLILGAVFAAIGAMTYQQSWERLSSDMNVSIEASADGMREAEWRGWGGSGRLGSSFRAAQEADQIAPPRLGRHGDQHVETPVAVYEFTNDTLTLASQSGAVLDDELLASLSEECSAAPLDELVPCEQGLVLLKRQMQGATFVAFANDNALESVERLLIIFAVVGIAALLVFFLISIFFSRWALKPVRQAWEQQREFVSNASHELKTPLAVIKANTEILLDEPDSDEAARVKWLSSTKESADSMEALVDDMLALASLDELEARGSKPADAKEPVDLSRLVEGKALQCESRAFEGGFRLETTIEENVTMRTDEDAVARLVQILLDNACKYVNKGGTVQVNLKREGVDNAVFSVSNTGEVIPPEKLDRIFDRFYRTDEARDTNGGHGLGLAIAKGLSDQLHAGLSATSTSEETCFTFCL